MLASEAPTCRKMACNVLTKAAASSGDLSSIAGSYQHKRRIAEEEEAETQTYRMSGFVTISTRAAPARFKSTRVPPPCGKDGSWNDLAVSCRNRGVDTGFELFSKEEAERMSALPAQVGSVPIGRGRSRLVVVLAAVERVLPGPRLRPPCSSSFAFGVAVS